MHDPETHLLPLALQAARPGDFELTIYGNDYPTPDGTCVRDYIHVSDLADAHVLGLSHLLNDGESLALNLGNGAGYSVNEVLESVRRVTGNDVRKSMGQRREGDPPELVGNAALARQVLNWNPQISALDDIVATAWHWMQTSGIQNAR
jgi:UDP-glucose 4-epimerase